jgi:acyl-homoserine lactone acylase PvdQ
MRAAEVGGLEYETEAGWVAATVRTEALAAKGAAEAEVFEVAVTRHGPVNLNGRPYLNWVLGECY